MHDDYTVEGYFNSYIFTAMSSLLGQKSFESVPRWLKDVHSSCAENVCTLLLGNKSDLTALKVIDYALGKVRT